VFGIRICDDEFWLDIAIKGYRYADYTL